MAKTARLDQILLQLRYTTEEDIRRALQRQKTHGGRLGMNLVALGAISEEQLLTALAEQFRVPTMAPKEKDISPKLVAKMPGNYVADGHAVPLSWNESQHVLSLAVSNPDDVAILREIKDAFGAKKIRVALAPEGLLAALGRRLVPRDEPSRSADGKIALPELFAPETEEEAASESEWAAPKDGEHRRVVMVSSLASRKNFLPALFEREGYELSVVSDKEAASSAFASPDVGSVLVSEEMAEEFRVWMNNGITKPKGEVVSFRSVSDSLLENPLPYDQVTKSLRSSVQALADYRCGELGVSPPYGLIASDVQVLAERYGMRRVAVDALNLSVHLLLPAPPNASPEWGGSGEPFGAFASSLELATRIRFPWSLDTLLAACHGLYSGQADPSARGDWTDETHLAAQILSIAWYRHNHIVRVEGTEDERLIALRGELRRQGGRLATTDVIEEYLRVIAERGGTDHDVGDPQVLLVGGDRILRALSPALGRVGREAVISVDLADAQTMLERRPPAAIVMDHAEFPDQVDKFTRVTKLGGGALLFVLTDSTDPALVLNLLDVGVDDVFGPPHDFDLVAARINRAIRSRSRDGGSERTQTGQFSASFEVFSFLDLIQMLGQGLKTVRIELQRNPAERAVIYMQKGRMTHAEAGSHMGEEGVFEVIRWEDEGEFTVTEETEFPADTIAAQTDAVLMEGLRRLDESKRPV